MALALLFVELTGVKKSFSFTQLIFFIDSFCSRPNTFHWYSCPHWYFQAHWFYLPNIPSFWSRNVSCFHLVPLDRVAIAVEEIAHVQLMICILSRILLGWSNRRGLDGGGVWHAWLRREINSYQCLEGNPGGIRPCWRRGLDRSMTLICKGKGKAHAKTGHEGPEGE